MYFWQNTGTSYILHKHLLQLISLREREGERKKVSGVMIKTDEENTIPFMQINIFLQNYFVCLVSDTRTLPAWRRFLYAFCGYEQPKAVDMSQEEESAHKKLLTSVREDRRWKWFVNINALILITFGGFLWGFFG